MADARLYDVLGRIDDDLAASARAAGCPLCDGVVHSARFPRKPRGGPADLAADHSWRRSFCCAEDGCRHRVTPPSVRFLGRKVYLGAVVVIASSMRHGISPWRLDRLHDLFGVSAETIERWRVFWRETFVESRTWQAARGLFSSPVDAARLPLSLLERFPGNPLDRLVATLRLLAPLTTQSAGHLELVEGRA
jgi:hypothetical protein